MDGGRAPGHACEYETSTMLHLWPERVSISDSAHGLRLCGLAHSDARVGAVDPSRPEAFATPEKGATLWEAAIEGNVRLLKRMIEGAALDVPCVTFMDGERVDMLTGDIVPGAAKL